MNDPEPKPVELPRDGTSQVDAIDPHAGDVDMTLIRHMLSMTPAQRLDYHDAARKTALEFRRAGRRHYGITGYDELDPESYPPVERPKN